MLTGIDHLVIAVEDPDQAAEEIESTLGLRVAGGGRHEALGTFNRLLWLGDSYVELVGIFDRGLAERAWLGRPVLAALRRGGGLATYALASSALASDVEQLRASGSRLGDPVHGERRRPDGRIVRWLISLPPGELGPDRPPFLIQHDTAAAEWTAEERSERAVEIHPIGSQIRLSTLEVPVSNVAAAGLTFLGELGLGFRPSLAGGGSRDTSVGTQTIRLRPLRGPGQGAQAVIRLRGGDPVDRRADLLGCRWLVS